MEWLSIATSVVATLVGISTYTTARSLWRYRKVSDEIRSASEAINDRTAALKMAPEELQLPRNRDDQEFLSELLDTSPSAAVMVAWRDVERALYEQGDDVGTIGKSLPADLQRDVARLWRLRNVLAHQPQMLSHDTAASMVSLARTLVQAIRATRRSA
jgi:3',5'-cyclic AMP phosphodiesterase CpdA